MFNFGFGGFSKSSGGLSSVAPMTHKIQIQEFGEGFRHQGLKWSQDSYV